MMSASSPYFSAVIEDDSVARSVLSVRRPSDALTRSSKSTIINYSNTYRPRSNTTSRDPELGQAFELTDLRTDFGASSLNNENDVVNQCATNEDDTNDCVNAKRYSFAELPQNKYRLLVACWILVGLGLNDGAPGAILPYMEEHYHINYAVVSMIWMANSIGFIVTACLCNWLYARIGRVGLLTLGPGLLVLMYAMIVGAPPFPVIVVAFFFGGLGMAMIVAQVNLFLSYLQQTEVCFGVCHGSYGIGAMTGPLVATAMISAGVSWQKYYIILLFIQAVAVCMSAWAFRGCDRDFGTEHMLRKYRKRDAMTTNNSLVAVTSNMPPLPAVTVHHSRKETSIYLLAAKNRITVLSAFFILFYQGAEVAIGGWIVSFMIDSRGGNPHAVGYIASGFWGGVTVGRFVLNHFLNKFLAPRMVIYLLLGLAIMFEIVTWVLPNIIGAAVAVSLVGLVVGPMYPSAMTVLSRQLPRKLQTFSLTVITAFGSTGGALWPFITGLISQSRGTYVLHPIVISLFAGMIALWTAIPLRTATR
ncbi:major facilitator superfamily domain-containing protein [Lipomyces arxii]|uniref:major facilitator superfamily domain-containing protein n=1 Tax=Lipomyces arxii TaxID=56418 RepID=UPI0034CE590C